MERADPFPLELQESRDSLGALEWIQNSLKINVHHEELGSLQKCATIIE